MYVPILLSLHRIDTHSSYLGLLVNLQSTRPMPTLSTIDIDSLEKPCLGNATQQVGRWRGGGTALLHLVLEEELGSMAGHSQTRSVVEWIEPAWSRQASALNFRWMTCFPLPSHDVLTNHTRQCHVQMRRAGVESQISSPFSLYGMYIQAPEQKCCWLQAKNTTQKNTEPFAQLWLYSQRASSLCRQPARPGSISDGQHIKHMLRGPNQRPQFALSQRQSARFVRLTRRSGPGATAQTKLVRLGRGPLVLNPSVGRRFSVPRRVTVSVGEVGVFGVVACYTAMLFFLHAVRSTTTEPPSIHPSLLCVSVRDHASRERGE
ncbi:hypothetical protein V8C43DRAFT_319242 [Trichoderma afarasin]